MSIVETVKAHPYITAGGVFVVGVVLIFALMGGSEGAQATPTTVIAPPANDTAQTTALQVAGLNASTATRISADQLAASMAATQAAIEGKRIDSNALLQNAAIVGETTRLAISATALGKAQEVEAQRTVGLATLSTAQQISQINALRDQTIAGISADVAKTSLGYDYNLNNKSLDYAFQAGADIRNKQENKLREDRATATYLVYQAGNGVSSSGYGVTVTGAGPNVPGAAVTAPLYPAFDPAQSITSSF
jgi:hypothetical protein